jgi:2-oxoglutarate ferredoxin oxidoreductase subunit beta
VQTDYIHSQTPIEVTYDAGAVKHIELFDGSHIRLRKVEESYDPTDRDRAYKLIRDYADNGEIATGLLYVSTDSTDMATQNHLVKVPLTQLQYRDLCPGSEALEQLQKRYR